MVDVRGLGLPRPSELDWQNARENLRRLLTPRGNKYASCVTGGVLVQYADGTGHLLDGLSMRAVWSRDYTHRLVVNTTALKSRHQPRTQRGRQLLVKMIQKRIGRTWCTTPTPTA